MPASDFDKFFTAATGNPPYDYQGRLAGSPCESRLINIPTGLGKTAAVVMAWLWNRVAQPEAAARNAWPRRLIYCLPMRTLVEQTAGEAEKWIKALAIKNLIHGKAPKVIILMGGEETDPEDKDWDLHPEDNTIIIGTQDMLLSRALNRGYGMSRYRWPIHFGLLNNDCLWVLDETQLIGVGVETSAQLDGFRNHALPRPEGLPGVCPTWWMSATLDDARLTTVDHPSPDGGWPRLSLGPADHALPMVTRRLDSVKHLHQASISLSKEVKPEHYARDVARVVLEKHLPGHLTLIIVNRVPRAQAIYEALRKVGRTKAIALIHSRFRPLDRRSHQKCLIEATGDRIVVATQAIEAGVDVSARILFTELAPWSSLVQRFGRCNRGGEFNAEGADVYWMDLAFNDDKDTAPYTAAELTDARAELKKLTTVGPSTLSHIKVDPPAFVRPVIRRKDLIDLFDTTPDLAGHDLDISRYIRDGEDNDVQVFWRDLGPAPFEPASKTAEPDRNELCGVAVYRFQAFLKKLKDATDGRKVWQWDGLNEKWIPSTRARPGGVYLIDHRAGGYDPLIAWTGEVATLKKETEWVLPVPQADKGNAPDSTQRDPLTMIGKALTLEDHTSHVVGMLRIIIEKLALPPQWSAPLLTAAQWHDVGKAMDDFQTLLRSAAGENAPDGILAKSARSGGTMLSYRKQFRHELASALAWLTNNKNTEQGDLIAYIIAAHHGKVRLSIRSLPDEKPPADRSAALIARGVMDGDRLPAIRMDGVTMPETTLRLDLMRMGHDQEGRPSWLSRMIALRDSIGPFGLAWLEMLLRAADMRASASEATNPLA